MLAHDHGAGTAEFPQAPVSRGQQGVIGWKEARELAFTCASALQPVIVPLAEAQGRTLSRDILALCDLPRYHSSAMDGWAVSGKGPWIVTPPGLAVSSGRASVIVTGGLVPAGANAILRRESGKVERDVSGKLLLTPNAQAKPGEPQLGQHIRPAGEEATAGELLLPAGTALSPARIALAAAAGIDEVEVHAQPTVAVVLTGSEVVTSGIPEPGQVRDTLGPQLATVIASLGGSPRNPIRIGDSYHQWLTAFGGEEKPERLESSVVIATGGTGRSDTDHFRAAIAALGGHLVVDGISMRPGHPAVLAKLPDGSFIVGLPGNPLAAMMALMTIGEPLLAALAARPLRPVGYTISGQNFASEASHTRLIPCRFDQGRTFPMSWIGSGMMRGLAWADAVMAVPPQGVQAGEQVPTLPLPWSSFEMNSGRTETDQTDGGGSGK